MHQLDDNSQQEALEIPHETAKDDCLRGDFHFLPVFTQKKETGVCPLSPGGLSPVSCVSFCILSLLLLRRILQLVFADIFQYLLKIPFCKIFGHRQILVEPVSALLGCRAGDISFKITDESEHLCHQWHEFT